MVTIITPCLNAVAHLRLCLESVAGQEGVDVEHIVVDGGSDDGTIGVLDEWGGRYVSEPDSGQSEAINKGFRLASGDIVTWLNADDTLLPGAVATVVDIFADHPRTEWVCGHSYVDYDGMSRVERAPSALSADLFDLGNPIAQPACFFRRDLLSRVGLLDEDLHLTMDFDLWYRFLRARAVYRAIDQVIARIEVHPGAKTMAVPRSRWEREFAVVRLRHGRLSAAVETIGRAAAHAAHETNADASVRDVARELALLVEETDLRPDLVREARAASVFEMASLSAVSLRKLEAAVDPRVLSTTVGRRMVRRSARVRLARLGGALRRTPSQIEPQSLPR